eukprot:365157-Chlamydomonas_euryale.AAC.6
MCICVSVEAGKLHGFARSVMCFVRLFAVPWLLNVVQPWHATRIAMQHSNNALNPNICVHAESTLPCELPRLMRVALKGARGQYCMQRGVAWLHNNNVCEDHAVRAAETDARWVEREVPAVRAAETDAHRQSWHAIRIAVQQKSAEKLDTDVHAGRTPPCELLRLIRIVSHGDKMRWLLGMHA